MSDTACPSCDAPAPAGASRCARCGYRFLEDGAAVRRPRSSGRGLAAALSAVALAAIALSAAVLLGGRDERGGDEGAGPAAAVDIPRQRYLEVLSQHPLGTRHIERVLTQRYLSIPDDDETDVSCSPRQPKPAHSLRRCEILYPGGNNRTIVVITNANGTEVLSER